MQDNVYYVAGYACCKQQGSWNHIKRLSQRDNIPPFSPLSSTIYHSLALAAL